MELHLQIWLLHNPDSSWYCFCCSANTTILIIIIDQVISHEYLSETCCWCTLWDELYQSKWRREDKEQHDLDKRNNIRFQIKILYTTNEAPSASIHYGTLSQSVTEPKARTRQTKQQSNSIPFQDPQNIIIFYVCPDMRWQIRCMLMDDKRCVAICRWPAKLEEVAVRPVLFLYDSDDDGRGMRPTNEQKSSDSLSLWKASRVRSVCHGRKRIPRSFSLAGRWWWWITGDLHEMAQ